jgi:hypothetical protein
MRAFACPTCGQLVVFENSKCLRCGTILGFDPVALDVVADPSPCQNVDVIGCNWVAAENGPLCISCALTRTRPADEDPDALIAWAEAERAKRRLVFQLLTLRIPLHGLAFDLLSSAHHPVTTGHADGVITIDLAESDDAHREAVRRSLDEPYRTMLGHLRHEVGHFAWMVLIDGRPAIDEFRALFGDERVDYAAALEAHYGGATREWSDEHVSAYAAAHPWEDWAETFAHYLHIRDTLETAHAYGVKALSAAPPSDPARTPIDALLAEWLPLTYALNALNRSMGSGDLYPFVLAPRVIAKLGFVHDLVRVL